jgi:hypothetical protein
VVASYVISYNNQNKEKIVITKFIARFSLFLPYMLFTICEFGCLLHVHTCIDNFEILLFSYINDLFFRFLLYWCNWIYVLENQYIAIHWIDVEKFLMFNCVAYILIISIVWIYFEYLLFKNLMVHLQSL